jgi:hypothetical protein
VLAVRIDNFEEGYHYIWSDDKFINRLYMIRELVDEFFDEGKIVKL